MQNDVEYLLFLTKYDTKDYYGIHSFEQGQYDITNSVENKIIDDDKEKLLKEVVEKYKN